MENVSLRGIPLSAVRQTNSLVKQFLPPETLKKTLVIALTEDSRCAFLDEIPSLHTHMCMFVCIIFSAIGIDPGASLKINISTIV